MFVVDVAVTLLVTRAFPGVTRRHDDRAADLQHANCLGCNDRGGCQRASLNDSCSPSQIKKSLWLLSRSVMLRGAIISPSKLVPENVVISAPNPININLWFRLIRVRLEVN